MQGDRIERREGAAAIAIDHAQIAGAASYVNPMKAGIVGHGIRTTANRNRSDYAMLLDPDYQLGAYASAETAPLNLVVDARTMKIEKKLLGDQPTILWPFIDAALAQP